ncbi:MAG: hypothetical protein JST02_10865 [Bacteroidetes bacterium]|nr:hypothetical protein [Bacteroidota bacterium]
MSTKRPFFSFLLAVVCFTASAQQTKNPEKKTILSKAAAVRIVSKAGMNITKVDKSIAAMIQPSIGLFFNERFFSGVVANFCLNERFLKDASYQPIKNETSHWEFNYTGLSFEYVFRPLKAISPAVGLNTGWGKAERNFTWNSLSKQAPEYVQLDKRLCQPGYFFFIEPSFSVNFNLSDNVSLKTNAGYRFTNFRNNENTVGITNGKFSGLSGGLAVQFSGLLTAAAK